MSEKYTKKELISELERLQDELGRVPKQIDMTLYGDISDGAYKTAFGSWSSAIDELEKGTERAEIDSYSSKKSYVYLIKAKNGYVKIGISNDVSVRMSQLRTASPIELELVDHFHVPGAKEIESQLHQEYSESHDHNEWFDLTRRDISDLVDKLSQYERQGVESGSFEL
jgi:hypothetical protein